MGRFFGALGATALVCSLVFAGCGGGTVIDTTKIEEQLEANLHNAQEEKVESVECPSGQKVEKGATFICSVNLRDGKEQKVTLEIDDSKADVHVIHLSGANE
jgi:hypothetical protein